MKQKNIDSPAQRKRKKEALHSAVLATVILLLSGTALLVLRAVYGITGIWSTLMLLSAAPELIAIIPVWYGLKKRWNEIEGGEEDAAAQY